MIRSLLVLVLAFGSSVILACSCFGPNTFCGVLNPPYEEPEWWLPDAVVMAIPLQQYHYGIDMVIVQVFQGEVNNDTVRVWGDNGALCRLYTGWAAGDTLILGLHQCDLSGNSIQNPDYPPDLEREEDYMISACGAYLLDFQNGEVRGPVDQPFIQSYTLTSFSELITNCALTNGVQEQTERHPLIVRTNVDGMTLEWQNASTSMELTVYDMQGRAIIRRGWSGSVMRLDYMAIGVYVVEVHAGQERVIRKVSVD